VGTAAEADIGDTGQPGIDLEADTAHLGTAAEVDTARLGTAGAAVDTVFDSGIAAAPEDTAFDLGIAVGDTAPAGMAPGLGKA